MAEKLIECSNGNLFVNRKDSCVEVRFVPVNRDSTAHLELYEQKELVDVLLSNIAYWEANRHTVEWLKNHLAVLENETCS